MKSILAISIAALLLADGILPVNARAADDYYIRKVRIIGTFKAGREATIHNYKILSRSFEDTPTECISVIFNNNVKKRIRIRALDGHKVVIKSDAVDYVRYSNQDPLAATVSPVQNICNNKYILLVREIKLYRTK